MKKIISIITSCFLFYSFIGVQLVEAFVMPSQLSISINKDLEDSVGKIADSFFTTTEEPQVIFIQDLHTSSSVQKNIANIIDVASKNYNIDKIMIEGAPFEKIDTDFISNLSKFNISSKLVEDGLLSGSEYYFLKYNPKVNIFGLEDWNLYLENISRAAEILKDENYKRELLAAFKSYLYSKIPQSDKLIKYIKFNLSDYKLIEEMDQPILQYVSLYQYWSLMEILQKIDLKKVSKENISFMKDLQSMLSYDEYSKLFSLSKESNSLFYTKIYALLKNNTEFIDKYKNLYSFLIYATKIKNMDSFELLLQKDDYLSDFINSSSLEEQTKESLFILKMTELFENFLTLVITEKDYNFFIENYERYIDLLSKYLSEDYFEHNDLFEVSKIFNYHDLNIKRNDIFVNNILTDLKSKKNSGTDIVILGGFHSSIINQLKNQNVSYILITPSVNSSTDNTIYNEIIESCSNEKFNDQALAKIPLMLTNSNVRIPKITKKIYLNKLIKEVLKTDSSPTEVSNVISKLSTKNFPIKSEIIDDSFFIIIGNDKLEFAIRNNKIVWEEKEEIINGIRDSSNIEGRKGIIPVIKSKFNVFQATSMKLNSESQYSSMVLSSRKGIRKNFMFSLSMAFNLLHQYLKPINHLFHFHFDTLSYRFMSGFAYTYGRLQDKAVKYEINFQGKIIDVFVEEGLYEYLTNEDLEEIFVEANKRLESIVSYDKKSIFIGFLSKSTNLFEDHLNNGFIGVNEGIMSIEDPVVKKAFIKAGVIHEFSHEINGPLENAEAYEKFEEMMMFSDIKYIIEYVAKAIYGEQNYESFLYRYNDVVKKIVSQLLNPIYDPEKKRFVSLFDENSRFIRKFSHYGYDINNIISFLKRKQFAGNKKEKEDDVDDEEEIKKGQAQRQGQLKHIEKYFLKGNPEMQKKLFQGMVNTKEEEPTIPMRIYLSEQEMFEQKDKEKQQTFDEKISDFKKYVNSALKESGMENTEKREEISNCFGENIESALEIIYRRIPTAYFDAFYQGETVIANHAFDHSMDVLRRVIDIESKEAYVFNTMKQDELLNFIQTIVYSAMMHDLSCILFRVDHERNSSIWAEAILTGILPKDRIDKIINICFAHKKVDTVKINGKIYLPVSQKQKNKEEKFIPEELKKINLEYKGKNDKLTPKERERYEFIYNNISEADIKIAQLLRDADGFSAALDLERILGVWLKGNETFFSPNLTIDQRLKLIKEDKYLMSDGGDAINDLVRQFNRRREDFYLTDGARIIIEDSRNPEELINFLKKSTEQILASSQNITNEDIDEAIETVKQLLLILMPEKFDFVETSSLSQKESEFDLNAKFNLFKKIVNHFMKKTVSFDKIYAFSDIHGGYKRLIELLYSLLYENFPIEEMIEYKRKSLSEEENIIKEDYEIIEDVILEKLSNKDNGMLFYVLGDLLDRGDKQVEAFKFMKKLFDKGKAKYVVGNHDLYAFMNLMGLHLPFYKNYKGIDDDYVDFKNENIRDILKILLSGDKKSLETLLRKYVGNDIDEKQFNRLVDELLQCSEKSFWEEKLYDYMTYATQEQKEWSIKEKELQDKFEETFKAFSFKLDSKGKDVLNNPEGIFAEDKELLDFSKKFFGRNVGIVVYTGIRAVNKMSINWWFDRQREVQALEAKYKDMPEYEYIFDYLREISVVIDDIINQQQEKYNDELKKGNISWAIIDAIMYRNYESTEWNALDWAYHKNWGGGSEGFIEQRNKSIIAQKDKEIEIVKRDTGLSPEEKEKKIARLEMEKKILLITQRNYLDDSLIKELLNFYQTNFYLYRKDKNGFCYMHSILPVDEDGDISVGYVDENGRFHERDKNGKRIKGFIYKGKHYKNNKFLSRITGTSIFDGLEAIAKDIRDYDVSSNDLSQIYEGLTLLTSIYADNTTRIKPANLKEMKEKFGFAKVLKDIGPAIVGHNPVTKFDTSFEYTEYGFFGKILKMINLVHIDGNMSPAYGGAGLIRIIGDGIATRGFPNKDATKVVSSMTPDIDFDTFITTTMFNLFPWMRNILSGFGNFAVKIKDLFKDSKTIRIKNTLFVKNLTFSENIIQELTKMEKLYRKKVDTLVISSMQDVESFSMDNEISELIGNNARNKILDKFTLNIQGKNIDVNIFIKEIKLKDRNFKMIVVDYDSKEVAKEDVMSQAIALIFDGISEGKYSYFEKYKNILSLDSDSSNVLINPNVNMSKKLSMILEDTFGLIPLLSDVKLRTVSPIVTDITKQLSLDKIQNMLSAA